MTGGVVPIPEPITWGVMMTKNEIIEAAAKLGLGVQIWAPGDGQTRYEFCGPGVTSQLCMGAREASVYLTGFEDGRVSQ